MMTKTEIETKLNEMIMGLGIDEADLQGERSARAEVLRDILPILKEQAAIMKEILMLNGRRDDG